MGFFANPNVMSRDNGFALFGSVHLLWLVFIALIALLVTGCYRHLDLRGKRSIELWVCWMMVAADLFRYAALLATGNFHIGYLPLHLCGLSVYLALWNVYAEHPLKMEWLFCLTLPGATLALLFPNWTSSPFFRFIHMTSFIIHAGLILYPILLLNSGRFSPHARQLPKCLLCFILVLIPIYIFNQVFGTNYMFLRCPSPGSPLMIFAQWFGDSAYLCGAFLLLILVWALLYGAVYFIRKKRPSPHGTGTGAIE